MNDFQLKMHTKHCLIVHVRIHALGWLNSQLLELFWVSAAVVFHADC